MSQQLRTSLRQVSFGKEEETRTLKPFVEILRGTNPAWQSWTSSQKRVLRGGSQHRPALRARRMVREGGSPPPERGSFLDSLCGRLRDRGGPRRRRPADHGGLAQADEQVRLDGPPGEDARGPVPSGRRGRLRTRGPELHWPPDIRLLGLHPLLGTKPTRRMGGQCKTAKGRLKRALDALAAWCRENLRPPDLRDFDVGPSWAFRAHRRSSRRVADW